MLIRIIIVLYLTTKQCRDEEDMDSKSDNLGVDKGDVDPCQIGDGAVLSIYRIQVTKKKKKI